jgi:hypothetical protein
MMKCRDTRHLGFMVLSWIIIMGSATAVFFIDYSGLSDKYGQKYLSVGQDFQQLVFPIVFWAIRYLIEQVSIFLVKFEVPKKIHLYNRFRSVLFYRLSFLNVFSRRPHHRSLLSSKRLNPIPPSHQHLVPNRSRILRPDFGLFAARRRRWGCFFTAF